MILDIRGTNGSGKSYIPHRLIQEFDHAEWHNEWNQHTGYYLKDLNLYILGRYKTICGGCDGIKSPTEICYYLKQLFAMRGRVLYEGITVSHTFRRYSALAEKHGGDYRFIFLDTPRDVCEERVRARRLAKGNMKLFDPTHLNSDFYQVRRTAESLHKAGRTVIWIDHKGAYEIVRDMLKDDT